MNKAFFVGGELDGTFQEVNPDTKEFRARHIQLALPIPNQGQATVTDTSTYRIAAFMLAPGVSRRIFVDSTLSEEEVEERMGHFMADLWDECADAND